MKAPARGIDGGVLLPFYENVDGRRQYRQIDDELLSAFEADVQQSDGQLPTHSAGMLIARVRAAEADRDEAQRNLDEMARNARRLEAIAWLRLVGADVEHYEPIAHSLSDYGRQGALDGGAVIVSAKKAMKVEAGMRQAAERELDRIYALPMVATQGDRKGVADCVEALIEHIECVRTEAERAGKEIAARDFAIERDELKGQVAFVSDALHRDDVGLSRALMQIQKIIRGATWLLEGRGAYEWDDDRYKEEAGQIIRPALEICERALSTSGTLMLTTLRDVQRAAATWLAGIKFEAAQGSGDRCDRYALALLPGVSFCRKDGARIVGEKLQDLAEMMKYIDEAKAEAQKLGRYTGQPLSEFLQEMQQALTPRAVAEITRQAREAMEARDMMIAQLNVELAAADRAVADTNAFTALQAQHGRVIGDAIRRVFEVLRITIGTPAAFSARVDLLLLRHAVRKIAAHEGGAFEWVGELDEHEQRAVREAVNPG